MFSSNEDAKTYKNDPAGSFCIEQRIDTYNFATIRL